MSDDWGNKFFDSLEGQKTAKLSKSAVTPGYDADSLTVDDWYSMLAEARNGDDTDKLFDLASDLLMLVVKWQLKAS